jgi:hypothetical protein
MRKLQTLLDNACACVLLGLTAAVLPQAANAQDRGLPVPPSAGVADKARWAPCTDLPQEQKAAIDRAQVLLEQSWLPHDRGYFAAYTMPGEKRNPFDLSPPTPDSGPRDGFVQARAPVCLASRGDANALTIRFMTRFYRFYEAGHGWSPPLRDGLLLEAAVSPSGTEWQASDTGSERSVLLPEQKPRPAEAAKLPDETAWAEPMPGCGKRQRWNGSDCVARKR